MQECHVYANHEHVNDKTDFFINDFCRGLWGHYSWLSGLESDYGRDCRFIEVGSPKEADLYVLPLLWGYYVKKNALPLAMKEAQRAAQAGHNLVIFSQGDFTAHLPFSGAVLFEWSTYYSRRDKGGNFAYAKPPFLDDYLQLYSGGKVIVREKNALPVLGFCGQADGPLMDFIRWELMTQLHKLSFKLHLRKWEPPPFETTRWRKYVLREVARYPGIQSNFLIRNRYLGKDMSANKDPLRPSMKEFAKNILDSDYTVCMRGGGNFSFRFYETLALGRIPVFVNTDCALPYDRMIEYRQYCVWVEENEIPHIGEKILAFHESLSASQFRELQMACYDLWRSRLSKKGFYAHFIEHFPDNKL
jgi:hypothetical protein